MVEVSVCISTFNRRDKLERAITSILMQDYKDLEIVIIDNNSDDSTLEYLRGLSGKDGIVPLNITYHDTRNPNAMETLNEAFWNSSGRYILVLDDDAYLAKPDVISKLISIMEKNPNAAIVGANVKSLDGMWQMPIRNIDGEFLNPEEIAELGVIHYFEFHGACALFYKSMVMQANPEGPYDESFTIYMNELDLATKMLTLGYSVLFDPDAVAYHDGVGDTNACNNRVYYFMRNYNTVITRNFRGTLFRLKAVLLHTFMSGGYYLERIVFHKTCPVSRIPRYLWIVLKVVCHGIYRSITPDVKNQFNDKYKQMIFEESMYNGFKRCIMDRMKWTAKREPTVTKGIR